MVSQGDIVVISFDPSIGHEQRKTCPALIVSNDAFNLNCGGMVLVCPISHSHPFPTHIQLPDSIKTDGMVLCDQMKSMDIGTRQYEFLEKVPTVFLNQVLELIHKLF